jgi:dTDP-glucose 4,6-dehydratase
VRSVRDCPVVVAGGCGFLGSHLVRLLCEERGCDVLVIDNLVAGRREFLHPAAKFVHADITGSEEYLRSVIAGHGARFAFNYASFPYIPDSFARPLHVFTVNANGALQFIHAAAEAGCEAILQVSSAEIYGDGPSERRHDRTGHLAPVIQEDDPVRPHSSYGAAKAAIDYLIQARWREARTPCIALRQFNALGERDVLHPYVVPEIIGQLSRQIDWNDEGISAPGDEVVPDVGTVRLGNNSERDFMYAGDAVRLAVELLEKGQPGEVYNLGSEDSVRIFDLAGIIGRLMGFKEIVVEEDEARKRPWEIWSLLSCNDKLYKALGYKPTFTPLEESLRRTIDWLTDNLAFR